jgi:hypothetical protein
MTADEVKQLAQDLTQAKLIEMSIWRAKGFRNQ